MMSGPLSGIRVVDFSRVLAGPLCARTLQDLGAEVIKVEPPSPDVSRFAFPSTDGMSGYYAQQNAGKRNVSINLNIPGAYDLALKALRYRRYRGGELSCGDAWLLRP